MQELLKSLGETLRKDYIVGVTLTLIMAISYQTYYLNESRNEISMLSEKVLICERDKSRSIVACETDKVVEMKAQLDFLKQRIEKLDKLTNRKK